MKKKILIPLVLIGVTICFLILSLATGFITIKPVEQTPIATTKPTSSPKYPDEIIVDDGNVFYPEDYWDDSFDEPIPTEEPKEPEERVDSFYEKPLEVEREDIKDESKIDYNNLAYSQGLEFLNKYKVFAFTTEYLKSVTNTGNYLRFYSNDDYNTEAKVYVEEGDEYSKRIDILNAYLLEEYAQLSLSNPIGRYPKIEKGVGLLNWKEYYPECESDPTISYSQICSDFILKTKYGNVTVLVFTSEDSSSGIAYLQLSHGCILVCTVVSESDSKIVAYIEDLFQNGIQLAEIGVEE